MPTQRDTYDSKDLLFRFTAYLIAALNNTRRDYYLEAQRHQALFAQLGDFFELFTETEEIYGQSIYYRDQFDNPLLARAFDSLNPRFRYILTEHIVKDRSTEEISKELGIGYHGVYALYRRALHRIREEMRKLNDGG